MSVARFGGTQKKQNSSQRRLKTHAPSAADDFTGLPGIAGPGQGPPPQAPGEKSQKIESVIWELGKKQQRISDGTLRLRCNVPRLDWMNDDRRWNMHYAVAVL